MSTGKFSTNVKVDSDSRSLLTDFCYMVLIAILGILFLLYGYELKTLEKTLWAKINGILFFLLFLVSVITLAFMSSLNNSKKLNRYFFLFLTLFLLNFLATIIYIPNDNHYSVVGNKTTFSGTVFRNPLEYSHAATINKEHGFDRLTFEVIRRDGVKHEISIIANHNLKVKSEEHLLTIVNMAKKLGKTPNELINQYQKDKIIEAVKNYFLDDKAKNLQLYLQKHLDLSEMFLIHKKGSVQILELTE